RNDCVHGRRSESTIHRERSSRGTLRVENGVTASEISQDRQRQASNGKLNPMPIYRARSIRQKLTLMVILASGAALLLACAALLSYELFAYREGMVRMLSVRSDIIGANSASALLFND